MNYDIFNGDADGICSLHQLRLHQQIESTLVTGVKRDVNLLNKITPQEGDYITVLDLSLDTNRTSLIQALDKGALVYYFDHHYAGEIPKSKNLEVHIDTSGEICTSLIVNGFLNGAFSVWAAVGAYGDNFYLAAERVVKSYSFSKAQNELLKELGTMLNYNGYGVSLDDLYFHPEELYWLVHQYEDPFAFISEEKKYQVLIDGYKADMEQVSNITLNNTTKTTAVIQLPNAKWARRVSGVYGNKLARENPNRAHALLTELPDGGFRVSVRAPLTTRKNADILCRQFITGGGRSAAAGINHLNEVDYDSFIEKFITIYSQ
jgi:oligoribonuclease NrnB/cAMP/cGMP phosphodiesterase (DHH superfamily)